MRVPSLQMGEESEGESMILLLFLMFGVVLAIPVFVLGTWAVLLFQVKKGEEKC